MLLFFHLYVQYNVRESISLNSVWGGVTHNNNNGTCVPVFKYFKRVPVVSIDKITII